MTIDDELLFYKDKSRIYYNNFSNQLQSYLENKFPKLSIQEQFYLVSNNLSIPICQYPRCNNMRVFNKRDKLYKKGCCGKHNIKLTMLEKYGVENPSQVKEISEKIRNTMTSKYGGYGNASKLIKQKTSNTVKEKYGVRNISQLTAIKEKKKTTFISNYGGIGAASKTIRLKMVLTNLKKFGVSNASSHQEVKDKIIKTNIARYGASHPMMNTNISKKSSSNMKRTKYNSMLFRISHKVNPIFKYDSYHGVKNNIYSWNCVGCNNTFVASIDNGITPRCKICNPIKSGISNMEMELFTSLNTPNKIQSDRTILEGKELDIYIPDKKLAIEFDGLFWHSESQGIDKDYHMNKTLRCNEKGIRLIHIFENEWIRNKLIVQALINKSLGLYTELIDSSSCQICDISDEQLLEFLTNNHIQGYVESSIKIALFYGVLMVQTLTLNIINKGQYEITRICNKMGYDIDDKLLLTHFISKYDPESIRVNVDQRYGDNEFYKSLGFIKVTEVQPNYLYFKNDNLLRRPSDEQSWDELSQLGYNRIWDCGQHIYVWEKCKVDDDRLIH